MPDLVAVELEAGERGPRLLERPEARGRAPGLLFRAEGRLERQEVEPRRVAAVDAGLVPHALAEHLQPAADSEHRAATGAHRVRKTGAAQPGEVGGDVLRAGQHDEVGAVEVLGRRGPAHVCGLLERL